MKNKNELQFLNSAESEYLLSNPIFIMFFSTYLSEEIDLNGFLQKMMMKNQPKWIEISHVIKYFIKVL